MSTLTVIHLAPINGRGGIATVGRMIAERASVKKAVKCVDIDVFAGERRRSFLARIQFTVVIARQLVKEIRESQKKAERSILHVHTSSGLGFFEKTLFVLLGRLGGSRALLHIHGGAFDRFCRQAGRVGQLVVGRLLRLPDCVVVLSKYWDETISEVIGRRLNGHVEILPNAVPVPAIDEGGSAGDDGRFRVVFIGSICDRKGCRDIIEAAERLESTANIEVLLYGEGEYQGDLARYQELIGSSGVKNVHLMGYVEGTEKVIALRNADLFILPSHVENLPMALLEAMSFGLPVVATRVGAVPELVGPSNGLLISAGSSEELSGAIRYMLAHPDERRRMGENNRELISRKYGAEAYMERLIAIYQRLL